MPADFQFEVRLPGTANQFLRPGKVFFDRTAGELYAVDQGHSRIVIFDAKGAYKFEFTTSGYCGSVVDFAVTPQGFIYVLGTTSDGDQIFRFDFDGTFLNQFRPEHNTSPLKLTSLAIDADGQLYLLDATAFQVLTVTPDGHSVHSFPLFSNITAQDRQQMLLGKLTIVGDTLYVPVTSQRMVFRFTLHGQPLASFGNPGDGMGELAFPVAVAVTNDGMILVVDKQRFSILCYTREGKFIGEFGGKGFNPGWFYYPSWIAIADDGTVFISQIFDNRVQACRIPQAIRDKFLQLGVEKEVDPASQSNFPVRHPGATAARDRNTNAVRVNHQATITPKQLWEV